MLAPNLAAWGKLLIDNALGAADTSAAALGHDKLAQSVVLYDGIALLGGLVLGAMTAFIVDPDFRKAAGFAAAGAVLTFFGFMHARPPGWPAPPLVALAYVLVAGWLFGCARYAAVRAPAPVPEMHAAHAVD